MGLLGNIWDNTAGGLLWKPLKKATGMTDAQLALVGAGIATGGAALAGAGPMAGLLGGAGAAGAGAAGTSGAAATVIGGAGAPISAQAGADMVASLNAAGYGGSGGGLLSGLGTAGDYAKAGGAALQAAGAAKGLLAPTRQAPVAQAQARPLDMQGLLSTDSQARQLQAQDDLQRRQAQQQMTNNIFGGGYGRFA